MAASSRQAKSLAPQGISAQFSAGIALTMAIPLLALLYLGRGNEAMISPEYGSLWTLVYCALVCAAAAGGFVLLRSIPLRVQSLRANLEDVVEDNVRPGLREIPYSMSDDVEAIHHYMHTLVEELRTRISALEQERRGLDEHLIQAHKIEGMGTMAAGVAHDFNNLLAAIMGNVSILLRALPPDFAAKDNALQIQETAAQAVELANSIALYSGHCRFDAAPMSVSGVVSENTDSLQRKVFSGVKLELDLDEGVPLVVGDRVQLRRMLHSMVENASEAIESRVGVVTITTGTVEVDDETLAEGLLTHGLAAGRYVYLDVRDDGSGISQDVSRRMFDPFFSTKIRGQGLGLPVVLGVVRAHKGGILVDTALAQGTTMRILLPPATVSTGSHGATIG